jgi:spermidine synthase
VEFYQACRRILAPDGVVSLHLGSPIHLQNSLRRLHASLRAVFPIVRPYLQYVPLYGTLWCMAMASGGTDPAALSAAEVDARIARRGIAGLQLYNGATHQALLAQPNFVRELFAAPARPLHSGDTLGDVVDPAGLPPITIIEG